MTKSIVAIAKSFVNLLYPLHCAACKKSLDEFNDLGVCNFCISMIKQNPRPFCRSCGRTLQDAKTMCNECQRRKFHFESARSACLYEGVLKELVHLFKYKRRISLAKVLSKLMIDFVKENSDILKDIDVMTFVPLQTRRLRERTFNQSKVLALGLAREFGISSSDILIKIRSTRLQNELAKSDRLTNLKSAFRVKGAFIIKDRNILLIDDVMTTGATLSECSKTLLDAGAKEVRCFTLARGM